MPSFRDLLLQVKSLGVAERIQVNCAEVRPFSKCSSLEVNCCLLLPHVLSKLCRTTP
jgi:hypothetical protein